MDQNFFPVIILTVNDFSLIDARGIDGGRFHGPGALETPATDGHLENEMFFDGIARLELSYVSPMKFIPIVLGFAIKDDEFVSG